MKKRVLSIIVCAAMIAASLFLPASTQTAQAAGTGAPFNYVALGDASTMGFGIDPGAQFGVLTEGTYPAVITDKLAAKGFDVRTSQLAMSGMRTEELRFLLDDNYAGDKYLQDNFPNIGQYAADFRAALANADLVTYELGTVDFGAFLLYVAGDVEGACSDPAVNALVASDPDGVRAALKAALDAESAKINSTIKNTASSMGYDIDAMIAQYSGTYVDAAAYVYYSFCAAYDETVRLIREMNPDADIVVLGMNNMLKNLSLTAFDITVDFGSLYGNQLIGKANAHMQGNAQISNYIDTDGVSRFLDEAAAYDGDPAKISQSIKDYCDIYEDDLLLKSAVETELKSYMASKRAEGLKAAYDTVASSLKNIAGITNVSISLSNVTYIKDNAEALGDLGKTMMTGLKNKCMEFAANKTANQYYTYESRLKTFVEGNLYGSDPNLRVVGRVIMAVGIRTQMGDGFFQQPNTDGHAQIADAVWNVYADKNVYYPAADPTCSRAGAKSEFWKNVGTGTCYGDAACTQTVGQADYVIAKIPHTWGAWVTVTKAAFCKDGLKERVCSVCGEKQTAAITGLGPAKTKIVKVTPGKKSFTVKWKKPSSANLKKTTGYQIRYSLKSSMAGSKTVLIKKNKTLSATVKKLKAKKKYYIQIRTYKTSGGKKYYSGWSTKKSVKTK